MHSPDHALEYCQNILQSVSRSFALGIGLLREPLSTQVMISYLICRILDTIEDSTQIPVSRRVDLLERCTQELFLAQNGKWIQEAEELFEAESFAGAEWDLVRHTHLVMEVYYRLSDACRQYIPKCIEEMANGMALTIQRERDGRPEGLETLADLRRYCHYVAGTVGCLLTQLFAAERSSIGPNKKTALQRYEEEFGLALQATNILKGIYEDYQRGVVYLPTTLLQKHNLSVDKLFKLYNSKAAHELVNDFVDTILPWLDAAIAYTLTVPEQEDDIRMFCTLPILIACRTLKLARHYTSDLLSGQPLKISRKEVKELHVAADRVIDDNVGLKALFRKERLGCDKMVAQT